MASATPVASFLGERDDHNLAYLVQYVQAEANPYRAARGTLVLAAATDKMANTLGIEFPKEIYKLFDDATASNYFTTGPDETEQFHRPTHAQQKVIPWDQAKNMPHCICLLCGKATNRPATVIRHLKLECLRDSWDGILSDIQLRDRAVDVFLPRHIANNRQEWTDRLKAKSGPLPSVLGKRDILPILARVREAMNGINVDQQQVVPPANQILGPALPPVSVVGPTSSAALVEDTQSSLIASPPSPPVASTSRKSRKRKAVQAHVGDEDGGVAKPKRARRGNTIAVADAATVAAAPTASSASTSQLLNYSIPIDPVLLSDDVAAAPAPFPVADSYFYPVPDWLRDLMPPQPAAGPFANMTGSDNEVQAPETPHGVLPASRFFVGGADTYYNLVGAPAPQPSSTNASWFGTPPNLDFTHTASEASPVAAAAYNVPVTASSSSRGRSSSLFSEGQSGYSSSTAVNSRNLNAVGVAEAVKAQNSADELLSPESDDNSPAGPYLPRWS